MVGFLDASIIGRTYTQENFVYQSHYVNIFGFNILVSIAPVLKDYTFKAIFPGLSLRNIKSIFAASKRHRATTGRIVVPLFGAQFFYAQTLWRKRRR